MREPFGITIIAKLSSSWQVKLQLHLNWDSYIITVRKCTPYPPHHPPTRASIMAMFYKHYCNWNWTYEPVGGFGYKLTLFPTGGGVDMAPLDQEIYFVFILLLPSSVPVGKSSSSCTWTEIAILSLSESVLLTLLISHPPGQVYWQCSTSPILIEIGSMDLLDDLYTT